MIPGQGLATAFQAVYFVFIGRALGSREYGAFVGVASLVSVLGHLAAMNWACVTWLIMRQEKPANKSVASSFG
jgi:hypothetical protein